MKLYIYDHCPFCVKARMIFPFKKVSVELVTLLDDDEKTPISMIGKKMVPILEFEKGKFMPESLDIISYIDKKDGQPMVSWEEDDRLTSWFNKNLRLHYNLAMPRWVQAPLEEFETQSARDYFQRRKESHIDPFKSLLENTGVLVEKMREELEILESWIEEKQNFFLGSLSVNDFHLFAFLRSISIVKGLPFPEKVKCYSEQMSKNSGVPLHHSVAI